MCADSTSRAGATLHIASASDANYLPGLKVLIASTLMNVRQDAAVVFHIFDGGIPEEAWIELGRLAKRHHPNPRIERLHFSDAPFVGFPGMHGSKLAYARLLLGDALPHVDKVVYFDSDLLVGRDPQELFNLDMEGRTVLACPDPFFLTLDRDCPWMSPEESRRYRYFNSGVLVIDLIRWRERQYLPKCLAALSLKPEECRFHDQTALNYVLRDDLGPLPREFNRFCYDAEDLPQTRVNFHVGAAKPWRVYSPRLDHRLWRVFYQEVIDPHPRWPGPKGFSQLVLHSLAQHPRTHFLFRAVMALQINRSNHSHQRQIREIALRTGLRSYAQLQKERRRWHSKRTSADASTCYSLSSS